MDHLDRTCSAALADISARLADATPPLHLILADIDALLALIDNRATKLALIAPAVPPDLAHHIDALARATRLLHDDHHGATLTHDIRNRITAIIDALRTLARSSPQDYLPRTGTLLHLIESARSPSGIPKDNQAAVCRAWKSDRDSLDDNLHEVARIVHDAESDGSQVDDGWDEIGLGNDTRLDERELARAKNVHQVLRLTTLLHKRILLDLLSHPSSAPLSAFDALLLQSHLLLSTSDDLVAALYTPQDPRQVREEILKLADIVTALHTQSAVFLPDAGQLTQQLRAVSLEDGCSPSKKRADKKWFDTCVHQILRICSSLTESSQADEPSSGS